MGSNPSRSTILRRSGLERMPPCHGGEHRFKSGTEDSARFVQ